MPTDLNSLDGIMGPPAPPIERAQTHIERARTPRMTPRQKSCDDMKRHMTQRPGMREGRSRGATKSATSQRKCSPISFCRLKFFFCKY